MNDKRRTGFAAMSLHLSAGVGWLKHRDVTFLRS